MMAASSSASHLRVNPVHLRCFSLIGPKGRLVCRRCCRVVFASCTQPDAVCSCVFVFSGDLLKYLLGSHRTRLVSGVKCHVVGSHNLREEEEKNPSLIQRVIKARRGPLRHANMTRHMNYASSLAAPSLYQRQASAAGESVQLSACRTLVIHTHTRLCDMCTVYAVKAD